MEQTRYQELKNNAFTARTKEQWDEAMQAIKEAVKDDVNAANSLRKYCQSIIDKKKQFWAANEAKKAKQPWTAKPKSSYILQDELAAALTEYLKVKTEMLKKQL